jgi:hypothetical protein
MTSSRAKRRVYVCHKNHSGARCPEPAAITADRLDAYVDQVAVEQIARLRARASGAGEDIAALRTRLTDAQGELTRYAEGELLDVLGEEAFTAGARTRRAAVDAARADVDAALAREPIAPLGGSGADIWTRLDTHERNTVLRGLIEAVIVRRVGRGHVIPVEDRVRVVAYGTGLRVAEGRGGSPAGLVPIALPDLDDPCVLRPLVREDALERDSS